MSETAAKEVEVLIRARYPVIYIVSWEESRVERDLAVIAKNKGKKVVTWSLSQGLQSYGMRPLSSKTKTSMTRDPASALDAVMDDSEPAVFIFRDFHPFLKDHMVIRKTRELASALRDTFKTLVIISPVLNIPVELEKEITVIDYDLPSSAEIENILKNIIREVHQNPEIKIDLDNEGREKIVKAAMGLTAREAENVFARTLVVSGKIDGDSVNTVFTEKKQIIKKSGILEYYDSSEDISDIGGLDNLKDWLQKRGLAFTDRARKFGLPQPRGALFIGVQGCGKSLCAKAVSSLWKMPILRLDVGRLFSSLVGSSEDNVRKAIHIAESVSPAILWIDELDKAFAGVQSSAYTDGGTSARVLGTFVTWMQEKKSSVFVIATANDISNLPPELLRKGRFDEIFFVDLPQKSEREEIFKIHIIKRGRNPEHFDIDKLAAISGGFSGAEIEQCVISGLYDAFEQRRELKTEDIISSIEDTYPLSEMMREVIADLRAWAVSRARNATSQGIKLNNNNKSANSLTEVEYSPPAKPVVHDKP
jgi:SpoVK/Ycf46/Vps4 family AAA+-type ATPase